jgi:hypothetical protein
MTALWKTPSWCRREDAPPRWQMHLRGPRLRGGPATEAPAPRSRVGYAWRCGTPMRRMDATFRAEAGAEKREAKGDDSKLCANDASMLRCTKEPPRITDQHPAGRAGGGQSTRIFAKTTLVSVPGGAGCAAVSPARLYLHLRRRGACGALFEPRHGCPLPRAPLLRRKQTSEIDSSFSPGRDPIGLCRERWDPKDPGTPPCRGTRSGPSAFSAGDLCARRSSLPLRRIVARGGSDVGAS